MHSDTKNVTQEVIHAHKQCSITPFTLTKGNRPAQYITTIPCPKYFTSKYKLALCGNISVCYRMSHSGASQ